MSDDSDYEENKGKEIRDQGPVQEVEDGYSDDEIAARPARTPPRTLRGKPVILTPSTRNANFSRQRAAHFETEEKEEEEEEEIKIPPPPKAAAVDKIVKDVDDEVIKATLVVGIVIGVTVAVGGVILYNRFFPSSVPVMQAVGHSSSPAVALPRPPKPKFM